MSVTTTERIEALNRVMNSLWGIQTPDEPFTINEHVVRRIDTPQFENASKVHDWRNYIDAPLADRWAMLSDEVKLVLWYDAQKQASREEWE